MNLTREITFYIGEHKITLAEFAKRCGISVPTLWKYLKGGKVSFTTAAKILAVVGEKP